MNFEEIFKEMEDLRRRMTEDLFRDLESLDRRVESGELEGDWRVRPIEGPGMRGFIAEGFFRTPRPLERPRIVPPPLNPLERQSREPLYDLRNDERAVQVYIELPGVEEKEINLKVEPKELKVEARGFHAVIRLPEGNLDTENVTTEYRNGVLTVTIPKQIK